MTSAAASSRAGTAVWRLVGLAIRISYRVHRIGATLQDGPVLLVANHPNSLLDPALVQATAGRPTRFLAKSTLFQGHFLSPLIRRSGAIPVHRRIDPGVDISRNEEMVAAVEAMLAQEDVVCLLPEGISHSTGRLEQLRTGAARIALSRTANGVRVAIVPIGLNFDRLAVFRSRVTVAFGQPFGLDDLASAYQDNPEATVRTLTMRIGEHLRRLMIEADPRDDLRMVDRIYWLYSAARGVSRAEADRLQRRRIISAGIERLRVNDPEQYRSIQDKVREYDTSRARFGLRERDVDQRISTRTAVRFTVRKGLLAALLWPFALLSVLLFAVPYWITGLVSRLWCSNRAGGVFPAIDPGGRWALRPRTRSGGHQNGASVPGHPTNIAQSPRPPEAPACRDRDRARARTGMAGTGRVRQVWGVGSRAEG